MFRRTLVRSSSVAFRAGQKAAQSRVFVPVSILFFYRLQKDEKDR